MEQASEYGGNPAVTSAPSLSKETSNGDRRGS